MSNFWRVYLYNPSLNRWSFLWFSVIAAEEETALDRAMNICNHFSRLPVDASQVRVERELGRSA